MHLGEKIVAQAFEAYSQWEEKWADDLEDVGPVERASVYSYMCDGIDIDTAKMMVSVDRAR